MSGSPELAAGARRRVSLVVNGAERSVEAEARVQLADTLRHELGLTGTHVGCEQGACGACTVLLDGQPVRSCLVLTPQADGATVETIESLALRAPVPRDAADGAVPDQVPVDPEPEPSAVHPVVAAMAANHGLQCGFCTPGIVVSLVAAHRRGAALDDVLGDVLDGHLCRCTGYVNIRAAIREAWTGLDEATAPRPDVAPTPAPPIPEGHA